MKCEVVKRYHKKVLNKIRYIYLNVTETKKNHATQGHVKFVNILKLTI